MNALLQLLVPASLLFAAPAADAPDRERGQKANKMQRYDADGSGTLSASEVAGTKMEKRFSKVDADGDGEVTMAEMRAAKKDRKADKKARKGKKGEHGDKKARKGKKGKHDHKEACKNSKRDGKQARKAARRGGKKTFAKRGKSRTDRKRFAEHDA